MRSEQGALQQPQRPSDISLAEFGQSQASGWPVHKHREYVSLHEHLKIASWAATESSDTASSTRAEPSLSPIAAALSASAGAAVKEKAVGLEAELGDAMDASAGEEMQEVEQLYSRFGICS